MKIEEGIGAVLLILLIFSLAASLVPVRVKHETSGKLWLPSLFTKRGAFNREIPSGNITLVVDFGQIDITSEEEIEKPYIEAEGTLPVIEDGQLVRMAAGHLTLHLPDNWNGDLKVKMSMGALILRDPFLSSLSVNIGMGEVQGTAHSIGNVNIKVDRGSVKLTLNVPRNVQVHVKIRSVEGSLYYDGEKAEGPTIERTFGEGRSVDVDIYSYSAEIDIRTWRD